MAADYQQIRAADGTISATVLRVADQAYIPDDPANRDRAEYDAWLADGGVPDPPDPPPEPPPPAPLELPPVMPVEPADAAPKAYVDVEVAALRTEMQTEIVPLVERMEAVEARLLTIERRL